MSFRKPEDPEFRLLCVLNNLNSITVDRALTAEEIALHYGGAVEEVEALLRNLEKAGLVCTTREKMVKRYYLSPSGVLRVLSMYS